MSNTTEAAAPPWPETQEMVTARAKEIDPERFVSFFSYGSIADPYGFGIDCDDEEAARELMDQFGRIWWLQNPDDDGFPVTAWDFLRSHPEATWEEVYAREEQWSRDIDPFHGVFR